MAAPDFSYWEEGTMTVHPGHTEGGAGRYLRNLWGELQDEHRFFSARDLELQWKDFQWRNKVVELGLKGASFRIFSDEEEKEIINYYAEFYFEEESGFPQFDKKGYDEQQVKFLACKDLS